jgi:hypothetical protein
MLFNKQESNLRSCIRMVEDVIEELGHVPDAARLETGTELPAWRVQKGGAHVYIVFIGRDKTNFIRVAAPVLQLEGTVDRGPLFRRLLELNESQILGAAFALKGDGVVLTVERSTVDLDKSEVLDMVSHIEDYAEGYSARLVEEFGGRVAGLSAVPVDLEPH